jgi:hypothetical protein
VTDQPCREWVTHGNLVSMQSEHCEMHTAAPRMVKMSEAVHNVSININELVFSKFTTKVISHIVRATETSMLFMEQKDQIT